MPNTNPMPLPTTTEDDPEKQNPQDPITLSWGQIFSLLGALVALKLLHAVSIVTCDWKPSRQTLEAAEQRIVKLLQSIVPESLYRFSPHRSFYDGAYDSSSLANKRRRRGAVDLTAIAEGGTAPQSPLMRITPSIYPAVQLSQCLSRSSGERAMELVRTNTSSTSHYNLAEKAPYGHIEGSFNVSCQGLRLSNSNPSTPVSKVNSRASCASIVGCHPPQNTPASPASSAQGSTKAVEWPSNSASSSKAKTTIPPQKLSPQMSVDEKDELHISNTAQLDQEMLEKNGFHLEKSRSVESFPGKFPVSNDLDMGDLATAPIHVRGKGATSVRPFSDL